MIPLCCEASSRRHHLIRLEVEWMQNDANKISLGPLGILTASPGNRAASWIFVVNGNASAGNAIAIVEFNVAVNLLAMWIIHNCFVIEAVLAHTRMTTVALRIHHLTSDILPTVQRALRFRDFFDFRFICQLTEWKWKLLTQVRFDVCLWRSEYYRIQTWRSTCPALLVERSALGGRWRVRRIRYWRN